MFASVLRPARPADAPAVVSLRALGYPCNDESNAPMLAINTRLGYVAMATQWSCFAPL